MTDKKKKSGFERLRGLASTGALAGMAALGVVPPGSARAAPGFSGSLTYSSTTVSMRNSWIWRGTCYQSVLSDESLTTSKGLALNAPTEATGMAVVDGYLNTDVTGSIREWPDAFGNQRSNGTGRTFGSAGVLGLAVNGSAPADCEGSVVFDSQPEYQEFTETRVGVVAGIDLTRSFAYLTDQPVIRGFYSFTNTTDASIDITAHLINSLSSAENTTVLTSSDGNASHSTADNWVITSDDTGSGNSMPYITSYTGNSDELVVAYGDGSVVNKGHMVARYDLTVPAGETVSIVGFIGLNPDADSAQAQVTDLASATTLEEAGLLVGLSANEIATIANGEASSGKKQFFIDDDDDDFLGSLPLNLVLAFGLLGVRRRKR